VFLKKRLEKEELDVYIFLNVIGILPNPTISNGLVSGSLSEVVFT
jgi:hypothetical protein